MRLYAEENYNAIDVAMANSNCRASTVGSGANV
jgi:hypothetical protein